MTSEQFHTGLDVLEKLRGGGKGEKGVVSLTKTIAVNREEDRKREEKNIGAANKSYDELVTNQNEILLDLKAIKKTLRN